MSPETRAWIYGLLVGIIVAAAGSIDSSLVLLVSDPEKFNLGPNLGHTLITAAILAGLMGIKVGCAYLAKSPLPQTREVWSAEQREAMRQYNSQK